MAVQPLPNVPPHSFLFVDANVFVYGLSGQSGQCRGLLERCLREELTGITLFETVNEVTHRFMVAEALSKGLISAGGAKSLRANFGVIPRLTDYWRKHAKAAFSASALSPGQRGHSPGSAGRACRSRPSHQ
jgi:predicted nucleic acid-binding protein